ncbi:partner of xrn-2 protein 1-like isoform X2 [Dermacentor silvarum]|uniref:partner of xrn-2 protein 1-like isoform X1 n=1 Tax=Dermacentor silvarum TaxID=543639 RepID=UPI00189C4E6F|nr:partner of xrn-2 protein 1-like isoform X1 [Dermacentor silvarum]XP_049523106.1 partner of xrn-2 protein 1-like isoform X2 [Dermacentor silvarum]
MQFPIDAYRQPWETDENWELRREFITANDGKVEEVWLLSLSQAFVNTKTLRCTYPAEVCSEVAELSKNVERLPELLAKRRQNRNILFPKEPKPGAANKKARYPPLVLR